MPWLASGPAMQARREAEVLDFPELLADLARHAHFERGAAALRALEPLTERGLIEERRRRVADWLRLLESGEAPDLTGLADLGASLERSRREGAQLQPEELLALGLCLRALSRLDRFFRAHAEAAPVLAADWGQAPDLGPLADAIERCLDEEGRLRDGASPQLARLRAQIREASQRVRSTLDTLIRHRLGAGEKDIRPRLRSGRLVLPVRREQRSSLPGIVHDESGTGQTLFVEPLETVELNNRVGSLGGEAAKEEARILRELTSRVGEWSEAIAERLETWLRLDLPLAVARSCHGRRFSWAQWDEGRGLRLVAALHPLLARYLPKGEEPVPLNLDLDAELRLLLVTGPNTGGKTVLLKTLGLIVLMNQSGLPLPVGEGTRLPRCDSLFVDIGDEQSLQDSRSTFSAHLEQLVRMVAEAGPDSLILVDEIGDGTDPEEGAALAQAVMRHWISKGARAVVSTHFGVLKGFAQSEPGAANAAMEFDPVQRRPLYTLRFGVAGSSRALATARRLGLDAGVLAEAETLLGEEAVSLEKLLERLEAETQAAERAREEQETLRRRGAAFAEEYERRLKEVRREEKHILAEARQAGEEWLGHARSELERSVREIRESQAEKTSIRSGHARLADLGADLERDAALAKGEAGPLVHWRVGDRVRLRATGQTAEILGEAGVDRLRLSVRGLSLVLPPSELSPLDEAFAGEASGVEPGREAFVGVNYRVEEPDSYRLDLRGLSVEEACDSLDAFLDGAVLAGFHQVEIIHGKGTGALREAVKRSLARDGRVQSQRLADQNRGGSGATFAILRGEGDVGARP